MAVPLSVTNDHQRQLAIGVLQCLSLDGKEWQVTIERKKKRRTLSQNALMWKWLNEVAQQIQKETGQDADDVHEFFKARFLPKRIVEIGDETETLIGSTKKLTTAEMSEYMNRIHAWAASELGIYLPVPEDLGR